MRYKQFGKTGMEWSELTLGTWGIGGVGWSDVDAGIRLDALASAVECGINSFDTAPAYNAGVAEQFVGRALEETGRRKDCFIATKCGTAYVDGAYIRDDSADFIKRQCDESLTNLRTDYIDLYLVHWPDANVSMEETMTAMQHMKEEGKIRHIGVSNFSQAQMEDASRYCDLEAYQGQYSMVHTVEEGLMQWCHSHDIAVMTYGSLGAGILTGAYRKLTEFADTDNRNRFYPFFKEPKFSKVVTLLEVMDVIAGTRDVPLAQIALNWAAQKSFVGTTIVGAQFRHKVEQNAKAFDWVLSDAEMAILDEAVTVANGL